jgi:glycosyltransferase involved in cell wall biosynthesis
VIANEVRSVPDDLGAEVVSLGKESGSSRLQRGWRYQSVLTRLARAGSADALLAHMCPVYLNLAAPTAKAFNIRTLLWFAHPARRKDLLLAGHLADAVITSLPGACSLKSEKVRIIGQGIDTRAFALSEPAASKSLRLIALGRTSPSKGYETLIRGIALARNLGIDVTLRIVGAATTPLEVEHRERLQELARTRGPSGGVRLEDGVPHSRVAQLLQESDALVSGTLAGSGDKAILEAMAVGRPVLVSNPAFGSLLEGLPLHLGFREGNAEELSLRIKELASAGLEMRRQTGRELRERVERNHGLDRWAGRVVSLIAELCKDKQRSSSP